MMIDHTGVNAADLEASKRFYAAALAPLFTHNDWQGCLWVSEKNSSRKLAEQAHLPTPRHGREG